jgi:hypothetical protein
MSEEHNPNHIHDLPENELTAKVALEPPAAGKGPTLLPALIAIALYMLVLAAVVSFGVVGGHYSRIFLFPAALFVAASFGLLRLFRWAWALTLAAVFLLMSYNLWIFAFQKEAAGAVQGLLNLVFFLYLVRVDVRKRLR